jgi:hypothetical protein
VFCTVLAQLDSVAVGIAFWYIRGIVRKFETETDCILVQNEIEGDDRERQLLKTSVTG